MMNHEQLNFEHLTVFVIDDNKPTQDLLRTMLGAMRIKHVRTFDDAVTALQVMRNELPDLVITDFLMEPMDGLEFLHKLRYDPDSPDPQLPVILLTSYTEKERVLRARDAGVNEILAKPVSIKTLYDHIASIVEHPRPFVDNEVYHGPDRRRRAKEFTGPEKRERDAPADAGEQPAEAVDEAPAAKTEPVSS